MAAEKFMYGVKSVKFGEPTGGKTMPETLTPWAQTVEGSMTISEDEATEKEFKVEEATSPVKVVQTDAGGLAAKWRGYNLTPSLVAKVKGGTAGTATGFLTYDAPVAVQSLELALEITTTDDVVINIYNASVMARMDGSLGRESLLELEVKATALDPGDGTSPWGYKLPDGL